MNKELYLFRKRGELFGALVFLGLFIYFAAWRWWHTGPANPDHRIMGVESCENAL